METELLEWCRRLIACRSVTSEGTRDIAEFCARELLQSHGLEPRLLPSTSEGPSQLNLFCQVRGRDHDRRPLVLNTHLDTVPPGDYAAWTECPNGPFSAQIADDRIYGLGSADTKLDFVAKVLALIECDTPHRDVYLIGSFGEEHGLIGAKELATSGMLPKGGLAFVGEPSRLQVITAHKGLMVFQLEVSFEAYQSPEPLPTNHLIFEGRSAHSSTPALGLNAIQLALRVLQERADLRVTSIEGGDAVNKVPARCFVAIAGEPAPAVQGARMVGEQRSASEFVPREVLLLLVTFIEELSSFADRAGSAEPDYAPPTLTFNPGVIKSCKNSISLEFEFRPPPSLPLDQIRQGIRDVTELVKHSYPTQQIKVSEKRANPGFRSSAGSETVELAMAALAAAQLPLECGVKAGCTEAGIYASAGMIPIVFGPGPSTGVIHAPNEYNLASDVEAALRFYRELLRI
ncbi:MAG TPA: M20/M25/M40 family metallo-hydrolase [Candidatus Binataceae bacterium]|nr:M20/M25/M40 family metallo-hydrolase [Candidatus Binataceae bacterium]